MTFAELLIVAQTLYYLVVSLAIMVLGALLIVIAYHLIHITRHLRNISDDLDEASDELKNRIEVIIQNLATLPIFGYFLKEKGNRSVHRRVHIKK
jgi:ABC-type spermidine/putrescine transport system permease subunit II